MNKGLRSQFLSSRRDPHGSHLMKSVQNLTWGWESHMRRITFENSSNGMEWKHFLVDCFRKDSDVRLIFLDVSFFCWSYETYLVFFHKKVISGAQWISPSHADLIQLVRSLGLTLETQTSCGERKVYVEEQKDRFKRYIIGQARKQFDFALPKIQRNMFHGLPQCAL